MRVLRRRATIITLLAVVVLPVAVAQAGHGAKRESRDARQLWSTVNVCDTEDSPDTIGVRASMRGLRSAPTRMYMRFVVQYYDRDDERWRHLGDGADSGYKYVGKGRGRRESGRSFRIEPPTGDPVLLRGRVYFQWREDDEVVRRATRRTRRGHRSKAGADPEDYSASTCTIRPDDES